MKCVCFGILLICMILCGSAAAADESNETALADGVETVEEIEEIIVVNTTLLTPDASAAFGSIDRKIMMVAEEAFDYLLRGNETAKEDFLAEYATIADDLAAFEALIDTGDERYADLKVEYDTLVGVVDGMGTAAETMFASYEAEGIVPEEQIAAFDKQVYTATNSMEAIWQLNHATRTGPRTLDATRKMLISTLLEAIVESYAYPITGDVETEKEEALALFAEFDTDVAEAGELYPDVSFEDLKSVKADLMAAAEAMFAGYEAEGSVTAEEADAFEDAVETFTAVFITMEEEQGEI